MKNITIIVTLFFLVFGIAALQASQFHHVDLVVYKQELSGNKLGARKVLIRKSLESEWKNKEVVDLEFSIQEALICRAHLNHKSGLVLDVINEDNKLAGFSAHKVNCEFSFFLYEKSIQTKYIIEAGFSEGSIIPNRHIIGGESKSD